MSSIRNYRLFITHTKTMFNDTFGIQDPFRFAIVRSKCNRQHKRKFDRTISLARERNVYNSFYRSFRIPIHLFIYLTLKISQRSIIFSVHKYKNITINHYYNTSSTKSMFYSITNITLHDQSSIPSKNTSASTLSMAFSTSRFRTVLFFDRTVYL